MKALRNPWVSGGLAALALAFVVYQVVSGLRGHRSSYSPPPPPAAILASAALTPAPHSGSPAQAASAQAGQPAPRQTMERQDIVRQFSHWTDGVKRDPFLLHASAHSNTGTNAPSQLASLKLKAIWHQTGGRVAVLNNALYEEGDSIEGYKIIRIDDQVVWLQNADSLDHLEFQRTAMPGTAAADRPKAPSL